MNNSINPRAQADYSIGPDSVAVPNPRIAIRNLLKEYLTRNPFGGLSAIDSSHGRAALVQLVKSLKASQADINEEVSQFGVDQLKLAQQITSEMVRQDRLEAIKSLLIAFRIYIQQSHEIHQEVLEIQAMSSNSQTASAARYDLIRLKSFAKRSIESW